jgi:hypothetical protein
MENADDEMGCVEGGEAAEANQELFVLKKEEGEWKIARYCFSSTLGPH